MRSLSVVRYYPRHRTLEEVARDYNANWTTAVEMLTDDVYLGGENFNNLFVLRRNPDANSEEVRCRLDTAAEFHLGEMPNKFLGGSLVMPGSSSGGTGGASRGGVGSGAASSSAPPSTPTKPGSGAPPVPPSPNRRSHRRSPLRHRPHVELGSRTLFATVDGTLGSILGLSPRSRSFFSSLERALARTVRPVGDLGHGEYRAFESERRVHPAHGFVDGDLVESFLDLDLSTMNRVVESMNEDGRWEEGALEEEGAEGGGKGAGGDGGVGGGSSASGDGSNGDSNGGDAEGAAGGVGVLGVEDVLAMVEEISMMH
uniref:RSE1/DDB1/CPSF1 C-terminal domain-containing protein n=1 Tax=Odontella aurita TaxID=265563 RepID=A0A7S4JB88_9STRA